MKLLILISVAAAIAGCGGNSGPCQNCDVWPYPNAVARARVESSCTGPRQLEYNGAFAPEASMRYTCEQFNPSCTVEVQVSHLQYEQTIPIASTCPSFP